MAKFMGFIIIVALLLLILFALVFPNITVDGDTVKYGKNVQLVFEPEPTEENLVNKLLGK